MSAPESKRVKTDEAPYELIYWPALPGRGEFIRLLFEEAGESYIDKAKQDPENVVQEVLGFMGSIDTGNNPAVFASPILRHGDLLLSQTPAILQYLAPRLGLSPKEGNGVHHLNAIVLTLIDGFVTELHDTHHPIAVSQTYEDQKPEAKKRAKAFIDERIPKFLGYAQRVLDSKSSGNGPWLYGDNLTYADIVLFQGLDGTTFAFPKTIATLKESGKYAGVFALYDAVKERPNIKAYLESGRRQKYSNGIWRHYPEFEE